MQKLSLKSGGKTRTFKLPIERPEKIFVEFADGEEVEVQKIYHVGGRAECIKILMSDFEKGIKDELDDLKHDYKVLGEEKLDAEKELEETKKELKSLEEKHEEELDVIQNFLEGAEESLGIETSARFIHKRIEEFAAKISVQFERLEEEREHFKERIRELEVDNRSLAWNIEELEKQKLTNPQS